MIEAYIRPVYQRFFMDPLAKLLSRVSYVKPDHVTTTAVILGLLSAILFILGQHFAAVIALLLSGLCDTMDGTLARISDQSSEYGAAWDIVADRVVEFAIFVALLSYSPMHLGWVVLAMLGASYLCVTTFLVVGIFNEHESEKSFYYSPGLIERPEAFAFFAVMMLWPASIVWLGWVYMILVFYTAIVRMIEFRRLRDAL